MGFTEEQFIRREFVPQNDSRSRLYPFVVETKPYMKVKAGSLGMVAFMLLWLFLRRVCTDS